MTRAHAHAGARAADPALVFAEVALGDLAIGIDTRFVVRALARPGRMARLPRSHGAIDGVFSDGGQAVPVVDLRVWMDIDASGTPAQVLVLGAQGRRIALAVDAVRGLVRVRASQVERIHQGDDEDGFFHSVAPAGQDVLLSLLDPVRLMERVQAWAGAGAGAGPVDHALQQTEALAGRAPGGGGFALVRIGDQTLALPAQRVAQVLPQPPVQAMCAGAMRGLIEWRGRHVPLLDPARAFGLADGAASMPLTVVLAEGGASVAFPVDAVVAVRTLAPERVTAARDAGIDNPLIEGIARLDDGMRALVIDGAALLAAHAAPGLSGQAAQAADTAARTPSGPQSKPAHGPASPCGAYVVVDTGRRRAVPMDVLEQIVPLPAELRALVGRDVGQSNLTCAWRDRTLAVLDLRESGVRPGPGAAPQRLLVVRHGAGHAALWVDDVVEMVPARAGETMRFRTGGAEVCMLTVGQGAARVSYPVLDLATLPLPAGAAA